MLLYLAILMESNTADIETLKKPEVKLAFVDVVEQYQRMVYNIALGILQQEQDAEDVLQDVFIKLYENWDSFSGASERSTWIYRIAVNMSTDALRKKRSVKRGGLLRRVFKVGETETPQSFDHPGVTLDKKEDAAILFALLNKIPEKQMIAFLLQQMQEQSVKEIAAIMNITNMAAESLLKRAKENLRKQLSFS